MKFEELLLKYKVNKEDITFDYSELSDDELEAKFAECFEEETSTEGDEGGETGGDDENKDTNDEENEDGETEVTESETTATQNNLTNSRFSVNENGDMTISYEVSHEDTKNALYKLVSEFEEIDNDYYYISNVYDDYFVYEGWCTGKIYGQKYAISKDNVSLEGERYELYKELLTASEKAELEEMRSNYSTYKENYEVIEKEKVLSSSDYDSVKESEEFSELIKSKNNYSISEVKEKADAVLLEFAKSGKLTATSESNVGSKRFYSSDTQEEDLTKPYGSLFK